VAPGYGYRDRPSWAQRHGDRSEEQYWVVDDVKETAKLLAQAKLAGSQQLEDFITQRQAQLEEGKTVSDVHLCMCQVVDVLAASCQLL